MTDISFFIVTSKENVRLGKNIALNVDENFRDRGSVTEQGLTTRGTTEKLNEEILPVKFEVCRICSCPSTLTLSGTDTHLVQLFEAITKIDVNSETDRGSSDGLCNPCIKKLAEISEFIYSAFYNEGKLENVLRGVKTESDFDTNSSKCPELMAGLTHDIKEEIMKIELDKSTTPEGISRDISQITKTEDSEFKCRYCEKSFSLKPFLARHLRNHDENKLFECDVCQKKFTVKKILQRHLERHKQEPFQCSHCEMSFTNSLTLQQHSLVHYVVKPPYVQCHTHPCPHMLHHGEKNREGKPFQCSACDMSFSAKWKLHRHFITHSKEKPFQCNRCDKRFAVETYLIKHSITHEKKKPFECEICHKTYSAKQHLQRHGSTHSGRIYKCDSCDMTFARAELLRRHSFSHGKEMPYKCEWCGKGFTLRSYLQEHSVVHTGEKKFQCNSCDKRFARKLELSDHMFKHTGESPFKCEFCVMIFARKYLLKRHLLRKHKISKNFETE